MMAEAAEVLNRFADGLEMGGGGGEGGICWRYNIRRIIFPGGLTGGGAGGAI